MINSESSSWHVINSDYRLSRFQKMMYLLFNGIQVLIPSLTRPAPLLKFTPNTNVVGELVALQEFPISPSRFLSNTFWMSRDWDELEQEIGEPLEVLEVGCGTGRYGALLKTLHPITYTGLDLFPSREWEKLRLEGLTFFQDSYENFSEIVSTQNLIITQSALEHFDKDLILMQDIGEYARNRTGNTCAIHLFPSSTGLFKFIFHGIRYYNLRTVGKLISKSNSPEKIEVYVLGGPFSNAFHISNITLRSLFLKKPIQTIEKTRYFDKLSNAIKLDAKWAPKNCASFYALVMVWKN